MKKLLCLVSAVVLMASLCACSKESDSTTVKIPNAASSKASMTYEEAIVPFESDEKLEQISERARKILSNIQCVDAFYNGNTSWSSSYEDGSKITNENGISDSMNALEEYFKSEPQYTKYVSKMKNPVIKDSYLKFIDLARETYQAFVDNPTKSVTDEINTTALEQYIDNIPWTSTVARADYYLSNYTTSIKHSFSYVEAYCKLTPEEIKKLLTSDQSTPYEQRMINIAGSVDIYFQCSAEGLDLDFMISTLDTLMGLKDNAYAIAVEAYGSDSQKLNAYNDFIDYATKLYNIVRVNRPEFNDTEYIEKQDFDLDLLEKYEGLSA